MSSKDPTQMRLEHRIFGLLLSLHSSYRSMPFRNRNRAHVTLCDHRVYHPLDVTQPDQTAYFEHGHQYPESELKEKMQAYRSRLDVCSGDS